MAALLVSLGVMAVLMSAALPVWKHQAQREKEAELIFRGTQYARAIQLYQRKNGQGNLPPTVDVLVQQRFLRKKYKDPMVEDGEFQLLYAGQQAGQPSGQGRQSTGRGGSGPQNPPSGFSGGSVGGGILGVVSKSKDTSIKLYLGRTHYNEWQFIVQSVNPNLGGGTGGRGGNGRQGPGGINGPGGLPGAGGGPGGRGIGPGGRGNGGRGTGGGTPVGPGGSGRRGGQ